MNAAVADGSIITQLGLFTSSIAARAIIDLGTAWINVSPPFPDFDLALTFSFDMVFKLNISFEKTILDGMLIEAIPEEFA